MEGSEIFLYILVIPPRIPKKFSLWFSGDFEDSDEISEILLKFDEIPDI